MLNCEYLNVPFEVKSEDISDDGTIKGYGSTFGGKRDAHKDIVVKGAFNKTISKGGRNGTGIVMLWQHNSEQPIGIWNVLQEDEKGLYVEGKLTLEVQQAREAHALMKDKVVRGLSIGWDFPRDENGSARKDSYNYDGESGTRYLKEIELWEISPATFPSNTNARVVGVKGLEELENATTPRELERVLRDVYSLSHTEAKYIVKLARPSLLRDAEQKGNNSERLSKLLASLKDINADLTKTA